MIAIDAVENLLCDLRAVDQAKPKERVQLALQRAIAEVSKLPGDLSVEKGLIGVTVEESQNCSTTLSEQNICQRAGCCSHYERNCAHFESEYKANLRL